MKNVIARFPIFFLILGFGFLLFPQEGHGFNDHHLSHIALLALPFLFVVRRMLRITGKLNVLTLVILFLFVTVHASPALDAFKYHHQGQSSSEHPCCLPQIADTTDIFKFVAIVTSINVEIIPLPKLPLQQSVQVLNNKSPPTLS